MSVIKKFNISLVLLLALLFSYSFAGTLTVNGDNYTIPYISNDYSVSSDSSNYFLTQVTDYDSSEYYYLCFFDNNTVPTILGGSYIWDYNGPIYRLFGLSALSPSDYVGSSFNVSFLIFNSNGDINYYDGNGYYSLTSASFPLTVSSYGSKFNFIESYSLLDFLHSDIDVFSVEEDSNNSGHYYTTALIYDSTNNNHGGGGNYFFASSQTQQQINDNTADLLLSSVLSDNLPSTYTNYYMVYDENREIYYGFFFPKSIIPKGYISSSDNNVSYNVEFPFNPLFGYRVYWFYFNGNEYSLVNNFDPLDFVYIGWDFHDQPVVYSNFNFEFYLVTDGVVSDTPEFTLHYSDITDSNNNIITSYDVLSDGKDDNNIWSMLFSIFNPPSTSDMASIESAHNGINSKADFDEFYSYYTRNASFFSDLAAVRWIILADNALYAHFAGFLVMCCFFITLSRIINS